jgi:hypothetical protein
MRISVKRLETWMDWSSPSMTPSWCQLRVNQMPTTEATTKPIQTA